ncbi:hypothetical protein ACIGHN_11600 [Acidovorax sp. NPDC077693]
MNKKATFNLQHNEAFEALGVIEAGTHWSAFDVSKTAAQRGEALRFAMAIWTTQGDADDPGGLQPAIIRDRRSGSRWYKFPREGSSGGAAENLDYLEIVHVFIRRPHPGGHALHQAGQAHRGDYSPVGLSDEELFEELA